MIIDQANDVEMERPTEEKYIVTYLGLCDYSQSTDWKFDLLTPLRTTHNYSTTTNLHTLQTPQNPLSLFQHAVSQSAIPWQRLLTVEIFQLHVLRSSCYSCPRRTHCQLSTIAPGILVI
jgi:hypothetical protein